MGDPDGETTYIPQGNRTNAGGRETTASAPARRDLISEFFPFPSFSFLTSWEQARADVAVPWLT